MTGRVRNRWLADLALATVLAALATGAALGSFVPVVVGRALGLLLLLVLPGYAVVAATFPERPRSRDEDGGSRTLSGETPPLPIVLGLAVTTSVVLVAVVGTALAAVGRLALAPVLVALLAVTVLASVVAAVRRLGVPPQTRRAPLSDGSLSAATDAFGGSRRQAVAFALAFVVLAATVGLTATQPSPAEDDAFAEFAVLERTADGDLVAGEYPETVSVDDGHRFHVLVENHRDRSTTYAVVVVAEHVEDGTVTDRRRLDATTLTVGPGERRVVVTDVVPETTGEDVRLTFLLYEADAPPSPSVESADLALHVWTTFVADAENASDLAHPASATDPTTLALPITSTDTIVQVSPGQRLCPQSFSVSQ